MDFCVKWMVIKAVGRAERAPIQGQLNRDATLLLPWKITDAEDGGGIFNYIIGQHFKSNLRFSFIIVCWCGSSPTVLTIGPGFCWQAGRPAPLYKRQRPTV